ncbi:MAG: HEAT repeat protein/Na+/melibiose symporter-like transporter [Planctomycetota bacterium]|jgi:HEAT repeat protein/Na+/melibiose symporter-like transporter
MEAQNTLSRGQTNRAMRSFIVTSGLWGAWGQALGIGTAAFTGFALHLGADESFIALFTSLAYVLALTQLLAPFLNARIQRKKRFIISFGLVEILLRGSLVIIPFAFPPDLRLAAMVGLIGASLLSAYSVSPFYGTWVSNAVPEQIRARFTSRQTILATITAMIAGFVIGQFIDLFEGSDKEIGFLWVFGIGSLFGFLGYINLARAPFPKEQPTGEDRPGLADLITPFRDANFRRAALFFGSWTFALGLSGPLYSVFMLDRLKISYTEISIFNAFFMVTSIAGYRIWAGLIDRFGSKAVLQILVVPAGLIPFVWVFNAPGTYYLVPVALVLSGICFSGIGVGASPLVYSLLPQGEKRTLYLASWSVSVSLMGALGPLIGGVLAHRLQDVHFQALGIPIGNLQIIFAISALASIVPMFLLRRVSDSKATSSRDLISQMRRGNLLSYAYNATIFNLANAETTRARAAEALGRSGNPLAIEQLVQALADASPKVRSSAARALGESGADNAVEPLLRELLDGSSDIRSEAAEALGRLGNLSSVDPLVDALEDDDLRVRISAIRGLGNIPGDEVHELLFWHFGSDFNSQTFPTLVDVLSARGDQRIVKPTLERLDSFRSSAVRLQLLNGVCRALGADDQFYRLLSQEDTRRVDSIGRLLKETSADLQNASGLAEAQRLTLAEHCSSLVQAYEDEEVVVMRSTALSIIRTVRDGFTAESGQAYEVLSLYIIIVAINSFLASAEHEDMAVAQEIFLSVCLSRLGKLAATIRF